MKLNAVILADDSVECDIRELCILLRETTSRLLEQYQQAHANVNVDNKILSSDLITTNNLADNLSAINLKNFISFWFGHGEKDKFKIANDAIVTTTVNHYVFSNALIYTFSCFNGQELADVLIANKAIAFVGYDKEAQCPLGIDDITSEIAQTFIVSFMIEGKQVKEAVSDLKKAYDDAVYNEKIDAFRRGYFQTNRDALVLKGDGDLTINDFVISN